MSVFSSRLSDSVRHLSSLLLPTSMATSCFNATYAEHDFGALVDVSGQRGVKKGRSFSDSIIDAAPSLQDTCLWKKSCEK